MFTPHSPFTPNQQRLAEHLREAYRTGVLDFAPSITELQCTNHYGATQGVATVCMAYTAQHPVKFRRGHVTNHDYAVVAQWIFVGIIEQWLTLHR